MRLPDFLVVGTARAGTTALHYQLRTHPQLFLPSQKEPCFFCFNGQIPNYKNAKFSFAVTDHEAYSELYINAKVNQLKGEISTPYLYLHNQTIKNIQKFYSCRQLPMIVIILRNPFERAYSQYRWKVRDGREKLSFEDALRNEEFRIEENFSFDYHYATRGLYAEAVKNFLDNFPKVKIVLYENYKYDFSSTMKKLCDFIGVDNDFNFNATANVNSSASTGYPVLNNLFFGESNLKYRLLRKVPDNIRSNLKEKLIRFNNSGKKIPPVSEEAKEYLKNFYYHDILKLQSITNFDLSNWLK